MSEERTISKVICIVISDSLLTVHQGSNTSLCKSMAPAITGVFLF